MASLQRSIKRNISKPTPTGKKINMEVPNLEKCIIYYELLMQKHYKKEGLKDKIKESKKRIKKLRND